MIRVVRYATYRPDDAEPSILKAVLGPKDAWRAARALHMELMLRRQDGFRIRRLPDVFQGSLEDGEPSASWPDPPLPEMVALTPDSAVTDSSVGVAIGEDLSDGADKAATTGDALGNDDNSPSLRIGPNPDGVTGIRLRVGPAALGLRDDLDDCDVVESLQAGAAEISSALEQVFTEADINVDCTVDDDDAECLHMGFEQGVPAHHRRVLFSLAADVQADAVGDRAWIVWLPGVAPDTDLEEEPAPVSRAPWPPIRPRPDSERPETISSEQHGCLPVDLPWQI